MIALAIRSLLSVPAIADVLADRVYPVRLPDEPALPAVAYQIVSEARERGTRASPGLVRSRVQLSVIGRDYDEAHAVASIIRRAIDRRRGSYGGIDVRDVLDDGAHDDPGDNSPQLLAMTWVIHWKES